MNRILALLLVINFNFAQSQILNDSTRPLNCYHDGAIFLEIFSASQIIDWYINDDSLGLILIDANTPNIQLTTNKDSLVTSQCGSYVVQVDANFYYYYIGCPLGSRGSQLNVQCNGDSTGFLKRVAHSGSPPYYYEWFYNNILFSSGNTDTVFQDLPAGPYKILFTDSVGCSDSVLTNIFSPPLLKLDTLIKNDVNCRGVNSGNFSVIFSGGKPYSNLNYDYYLIDSFSNDTVLFINRDSITNNSFFNFSNNQVLFDSLFSSDYVLSVVDSFNCISSIVIQINEPIPYQTYASTTFPLICESDSGYLMIDSITGGGNITYGFMYDDIIGPYEDSLYVPSGWYDIYIEDLDFGCIDTVPVRCTAQYEILVFSTLTDILCFGDSTGSIIIDSIVGGNEPYDVQWGGINNEELSAGLYNVFIVDSIGCVHQEIYEIYEPNIITSNANIYTSPCFGLSQGSITIDPQGGTFPLSYFWLNGTGNADSLYSLSDGLYTLIVSDSFSCVDTFNYYLNSPDELISEILVEDSNLTCIGDQVSCFLNISGGTSPYNILWSDNDTNQQKVLSSGYYQVEVIDENLCSATAEISIIQPDSLNIEISYTPKTCNEGASVSVLVEGGVGQISFLWSTGDTTQFLDSLWDQIYWVMVFDSCGQSVSDTIYLDDYILNTQINFNNLNHTASIEITSSSSSGPFTFQWFDLSNNIIGEGQTSPILCEGTYYAVTTDESTGCFIQDTIDVEFDLPFGIVDISTTTAFSDSNLWGFGPYTYLWSNGEINNKAFLCPGNHWIEIIDTNDCLVRQDFSIDDLVISLDPADAIIECGLENIDVEIEASATGGTSPYTFEWWNGSIENPINLGLSPGNFSISLTDANNCFTDTSFNIATMSADCIPNVFTPNSDNINDTWNLEDTYLYNDSKVKIYGRFGKLIFQSVGYNEKWDGKNDEGIDVPDGVYFYVIEIGNGFDDIIGTVTILR